MDRNHALIHVAPPTSRNPEDFIIEQPLNAAAMEELGDDDQMDSDEGTGREEEDKPKPRPGKKTRGRVKIKFEYITKRERRYTTFSKRKTGLMKKAYELSALTGTQVMLLVASETGHVYTFATRKLMPIVTSREGKELIQTCLSAPDPEEPNGSQPKDKPGKKNGSTAAGGKNKNSSTSTGVWGDVHKKRNNDEREMTTTETSVMGNSGDLGTTVVDSRTNSNINTDTQSNINTGTFVNVPEYLDISKLTQAVVTAAANQGRVSLASANKNRAAAAVTYQDQPAVLIDRSADLHAIAPAQEGVELNYNVLDNIFSCSNTIMQLPPTLGQSLISSSVQPIFLDQGTAGGSGMVVLLPGGAGEGGRLQLLETVNIKTLDERQQQQPQ